MGMMIWTWNVLGVERCVGWKTWVAEDGLAGGAVQDLGREMVVEVKELLLLVILLLSSLRIGLRIRKQAWDQGTNTSQGEGCQGLSKLRTRGTVLEALLPERISQPRNVGRVQWLRVPSWCELTRSHLTAFSDRVWWYMVQNTSPRVPECSW